jgi:hypothetical protein
MTIKHQERKKGTAHMPGKNRAMGKLRTLRFVYSFIGLFLIIGIGNACGKDDSSDFKDSAALKPLQACELLTKAEVEAIFRTTVEEPRRTFKENKRQQFWVSTCDYYSPASSQRAGILIKNSQNADPAKAFEAHTASLKKALGDKYGIQAIDGIGARAAWDGSVKQLTVFEGRRMFIVTVGGPGEDERTTLETAKMIAAKVLSRLPR